MTHICISKLTIIGSDNGLSPGRRRALAHWGLDKIAPFPQTFSHAVSWTKMYKFRLTFHWTLCLRIQLKYPSIGSKWAQLMVSQLSYLDRIPYSLRVFILNAAMFPWCVATLPILPWCYPKQLIHLHHRHFHGAWPPCLFYHDATPDNWSTSITDISMVRGHPAYSTMMLPQTTDPPPSQTFPWCVATLPILPWCYPRQLIHLHHRHFHGAWPPCLFYHDATPDNWSTSITDISMVHGHPAYSTMMLPQTTDPPPSQTLPWCMATLPILPWCYPKQLIHLHHRHFHGAWPPCLFYHDATPDNWSTSITDSSMVRGHPAYSTMMLPQTTDPPPSQTVPWCVATLPILPWCYPKQLIHLHHRQHVPISGTSLLLEDFSPFVFLALCVPAVLGGLSAPRGGVRLGRGVGGVPRVPMPSAVRWGEGGWGEWGDLERL